MFSNIKNHPQDPIEALYLRAQADTRAETLNLGIGVYRDNQGNAPIFKSVRDAELRVVQAAATKSYMSSYGNLEYIAACEKLVFGKEHKIIKDKRVISAQCPGAGAGLRVGAELAKSLNALDCSKEATRVWFSDPVWNHQVGFFTGAGLQDKYYSYYNQDKCSIDFEAMLKSLEALRPNDLVVIHGCCHNPTGADLNLHQWQKLTEFLQEKQAIPFVDIAYQGYGAGIEQDVEGARYMASKMDNMLLTLSSSKSFGVYRDRAGLISVIHSSSDADSLKRYIGDLIRSIYFMPPNHAAAVIAEILNDSNLEQLWRSEVDSIRKRIQGCRNALSSAIASIDPTQRVDYLQEQKGMFSCFPLNSEQLKALESEYAIYLLPNGRINFAAMSESHAPRIAKALCAL